METYDLQKFNRLANQILNAAGYFYNINIFELKNQTAKKWYEKQYISCTELCEGKIYGVSVDGTIDFDLKINKIENLLKTFLTAFANKIKQYKFNPETGNVEPVSKDKLLSDIVEKNRDRVYDGLLYTTLYGIGFWAIFCSKQDKESAKSFAEYLRKNKIKYYNEFSDAGWVLRFVIKQSVESHNRILSNFRTE